MRYLKSIPILLFIIFLYIWTSPRLNKLGTVKMYDVHNTLLFEFAGNTGRMQPVTYEKFPKNLVNAVIASEDEGYWEHPGVDLKAIGRSAILNIRSGKIVSGASTITQQVSRLNSTDHSSNLILRSLYKIQQVLIALRLSATYSKQEILKTYLNEVYLGNHNYGFQSASLFYFNKNVDKLSLNESAYLAGLIASPAQYDPYLHQSEGEKRKAYVLNRMGAHGYITGEQLKTARQQNVVFSKSHSFIQTPHFVDYINAQIENMHIPYKDISVYTTLDLDAYTLGERIAKDAVERLKNIHNVHNASMVVLDNKTGAIVAMLGGVDYFAHDGQVNLATSPRQPGSAIKLITYTTAFLKGFTPATLIYDVKRSYTTKKGEGFIPNNFGDKYHGLVLLREAFASSYNVPAVDMLHRVGLEAFLKTARDLGISTFTDSDRYDYSITLGANEVSLLELTNAYATIARGGKYVAPFAIKKILDTNGRNIYVHTTPLPTQRLGNTGEQVSYLITNILSDPQARMPGFGEKNSLTLTRPAAVKTGTTTDWHDIWTVGYTPSYTVGVWMGNNNNDAMRNISSATGAAPVWNEFFEEFLKGKPVEEFVKPRGLIRKEICTLSGDLYDSICPQRRTELFISGTEPKRISTLHKLITVDRRNNLLADAQCALDYGEKKVFVNYPPAVFSWALQNKKPIIPTEYSPLCGTKTHNWEYMPIYITITNPKNKSVYQNAPRLIRNQGITFEVSVSENVKRVIWNVDGLDFQESTSRPFNVIYPLHSGEHSVYAKGISSYGEKKSDTVKFSIIDY